MKIITAPEKYILNELEISCFLAGGISNCQNWQQDVINILKENIKKYSNDRFIIFNPRRENFPINNSNAAFEQIKWEYEWLEKCQIFSMFFVSQTQSDQPICFYELGRNIERMKQKFPNDWEKRIIISIDLNFKRANDVIIQTNLASNNKIKINVNNSYEELIKIHSNEILSKFNILKEV